MEEDLKIDLEEAWGNLDNAIRVIRGLNEISRDRYFSLAITHAEEAQNWLYRWQREYLKGK